MALISIRCNKYLIIYTDERIHSSDISYFARKDEAVKHFMLIKARTKQFYMESCHRLITVKRDQEIWCEKNSLLNLKKNRIKSNLTAQFTPQQDIVAKTSNGITVNNTNMMMNEAGCLPVFWVAAMETAIYIWNRLHLKAICAKETKTTVEPNERKTVSMTYKLWLVQKPKLRYLHVWGCKVFIIVLKKKIKIFDDHNIRAMFIRYMGISKQYRCYDLMTRQKYFISEVIFHKSVSYYWKKILNSTKYSEFEVKLYFNLTQLKEFDTESDSSFNNQTKMA